jgi:hypothetical protein
MRRGKLTVPELQAVETSPPAGSTGRNKPIEIDEFHNDNSFFVTAMMQSTSLSEWRKLPLSLGELCINTTLRCGQSFRFVANNLPPRPC